MINRKLKVGDKLRCVKNNPDFSKGAEIKIENIDKNDVCIGFGKLYEFTDWYRNFPFDCFELIEQSPEQTLFHQDDADKFKSITDSMCETFKRKNHDYGNSFSESCDEEGLAASRIRLGDKWKRYKTLSKGEVAQVQDEKIEDTLLDMANYCIMTVMWMQDKKNKEKVK